MSAITYANKVAVAQLWKVMVLGILVVFTLGVELYLSSVHPELRAWGALIYFPMLVIIALFGLRLVPLLATGVGGGIVGLLWDRDKSQGAGKGIYWYLWGVRKVFWFYAVLGALPILVSFEHSPQSYLGFVLVQTVVLAAQKDITAGVVRWLILPIFAVVVIWHSVWAMFPPYVKGVYFAHSKGIYTMEADGSEIHHDLPAKFCATNRHGIITGMPATGAPTGTDCTSKYDGSNLAVVTKEAATEHGFRPWTIRTFKSNFSKLLSFDWWPTRAAGTSKVTKPAPREYFQTMFKMKKSDGKITKWMRPGVQIGVTVPNKGAQCLYAHGPHALVDGSAFPVMIVTLKEGVDDETPIALEVLWKGESRPDFTCNS